MTEDLKQVDIYLDILDRWCYATDAYTLIYNDRISDQGKFITISSYSNDIEDVNNAVYYYLNQ